MRFFEVLTPSRGQILVIFGNGKTDKKIVREMAPRFDGSGCALAWTQLPISHQRKRTVKRGLGSLDALTLVLHKGYRIDEALFVVDKEHIGPNAEEVVKYLRGRGFRVDVVREIGENAWYLEVFHGPNPLRLYIAVAGRERNMNEEIQELRQILRTHESVEKLIKRIGEVDVEVLKRCFRGLTTIFCFIEKQCVKA